MHIDELIGYKQNPIWQHATKNLSNDSIESVRDISNYSKRKTKLNEFTLLLNKYGFVKLGQGVFGAVFEKPGYPWIFKIFNNDPAYFAFIKFVKQHQGNPYLPEIKGNIIHIVDNTYAVRVEKLQPLNDTDIANTLVDYLNVENLSCIDDDGLEFLDNYFPGLYQLLLQLEALGYAFDLHHENIMQRNNCPVLSDPLVEPGNLDENR